MANHPKATRYRERFGPRGVILSWATDKDNATVEERRGKVGRQKIADTGPPTRKRMETCGDEFVAAAIDFIKRRKRPASRGSCGSMPRTCICSRTSSATMIDHDRNVGQMLDLLDELGIAGDTFVQYSTDNGPHRNTWPDGGTTPFRSEKNWEGAFRIPMLIRWPGKVPAGAISNEIVPHHDWLPTFLEMAGVPDVVDKLKAGYKAIGRTYRNHIDGFSLLAYITGQAEEGPRKLFFCISDDGDILALRFDNWKIVFLGRGTTWQLRCLPRSPRAPAAGRCSRSAIRWRPGDDPVYASRRRAAHGLVPSPRRRHAPVRLRSRFHAQRTA